MGRSGLQSPSFQMQSCRVPAGSPFGQVLYPCSSVKSVVHSPSCLRVFVVCSPSERRTTKEQRNKERGKDRIRRVLSRRIQGAELHAEGAEEGSLLRYLRCLLWGLARSRFNKS